MTTFVTYRGVDEVLVTTKKNEEMFKHIYFNDPTDRNIEDYDRIEKEGLGIIITAGQMWVDHD